MWTYIKETAALVSLLGMIFIWSFILDAIVR